MSVLKHLIVCSLPLSVAACAPVSGPVDVKAVVWNEAAGAIEYTATTLETPVDLFGGVGDGLHFVRDVHYELGPSLVAAGVSNVLHIEDGRTLGEVVAANRAEAGGAPLSLHLHEEDGVYVADDYDSMVALSAWSSLERARAFLVGAGEDGPAVSEELPVSLHGRLTVAGVVIAGPDNAAYSAPLDMMVIGQPALKGQSAGFEDVVPYSVSPAVIAHELGHRVLAFRLKEPTNIWRATVSADPVGENLLDGIDEGFSDLVALGVLGTPYLEEAGFPLNRNLIGSFADAVTYDTPAPETGHSCWGEDTDPQSEDYREYCHATFFAASVFEASGQDIGTFRAVVFPSLLRALDEAAARMNARVEAGEPLTFGMEDLLDPLVRGVDDAAVRETMCDAFSRRYASLVQGGVLCAD